MIERSLDLDAIRAFVYIAQFESFTRAAEVTNTTQAAVSLKLKRLEERLDCRLIERSPRYVRLSKHGAVFIEHARKLLNMHDRAFSVLCEARQRLVIGISDHVAGPELPALIASISDRSPNLLIEIRIGSSNNLLQEYDRREFDAVIVRFDAERDDGQVLAIENFGWFAAKDWQHRDGEPLPIAVMPEPCGVRRMAEKYLDEAGIPWAEAFVGGGVAAVSAAVMARLGIAALTRRMLPLGAIDVGPTLGLPKLPSLPVVLHTRIKDGYAHNALSELSVAFRSVA